MVHVDASSNNSFISVVGSVGMLGTLFHALDECVSVGAHEMHDSKYVDVLVDHRSLRCAAGNAVEHQQICIGAILVGVDEALYVLSPETNSEIVRDEETLYRVLEELLAEFALAVETAEHVAGCQMDESRDRAEDLALRSLPNAGLSKQKNGLEGVAHGACRIGNPTHLGGMVMNGLW